MVTREFIILQKQKMETATPGWYVDVVENKSSISVLWVTSRCPRTPSKLRQWCCSLCPLPTIQPIEPLLQILFRVLVALLKMLLILNLVRFHQETPSMIFSTLQNVAYAAPSLPCVVGNMQTIRWAGMPLLVTYCWSKISRPGARLHGRSQHLPLKLVVSFFRQRTRSAIKRVQDPLSFIFIESTTQVKLVLFKDLCFGRSFIFFFFFFSLYC